MPYPHLLQKYWLRMRYNLADYPMGSPSRSITFSLNIFSKSFERALLTRLSIEKKLLRNTINQFAR